MASPDDSNGIRRRHEMCLCNSRKAWIVGGTLLLMGVFVITGTKTIASEISKIDLFDDHTTNTTRSSVLSFDKKKKKKKTFNVTESEFTLYNEQVYREYNITQVSPLYDRSVYWDPNVERLWLNNNNNNDDDEQQQPPAMIVLLNEGYNNPNQSLAMTLIRSVRQRELYEGVVNHPLFHPTAFDDIHSGRMRISNTTRYYVFRDTETCADKQYPHYGHGLTENLDRQHGRGDAGIHTMKHSLRDLFMATKFSEARHSVYILPSCEGVAFNGVQGDYWTARKLDKRNQIAFLPLSFNARVAAPQDQGLLPPACKKFKLTDEERADIETCRAEDSRPVLVSFAGKTSMSDVRFRLSNLHNGKDVLVFKNRDRTVTSWFAPNITDYGEAFGKLARSSVFGAVPRGDCLFSYRLTEVISVGAIPVIYSDNWLLPFGRELFHWKDVAVIIPEAEVNNTVAILTNITKEKRCLMRKRLVEVYDKYMETGTKVIAGVIETFELRAQNKSNRW